MLTTWLRRGRNSLLVSFILLAGASLYAVDLSAKAAQETLYESQLEACKELNILREASNARDTVRARDTAVLRDFLESAATAREAAFRRTGAELDRTAARAFRKGSKGLSAADYRTVPPINCEEVIAKP